MSEKDNEIVWRAAEFKYHKKGLSWYLSVIGLSSVLIIFSLWQNNFFFAVFITIAGAMVLFLGKKKPKVVEFRITNNGIEIGKDTEYSYKRLEGFTVREYEDRLNEIVIKRDSFINPFIRMPIDSTMLPKAKDKINEHLPKKEYEESLVDIFSDYFQF